MANVSLKDVYKYYRTDTEDVLAVENMNLEINDGELMVFLGPSGCGKSTTMRMIAGLEKITQGQIYIGERLVNDLSPCERNIAMAFETYALYTHLTARENLAFCLRAQRIKKEQIREKVSEVARLLHIEDILDKRPSELSGGHQQRLSLGRALIRNPEVFLLDEPLSHLDAKLRVQIRAEIRQLHRMLQTTMIHITHDQVEALALADRIAIMNFGTLQQVATPEEIFNRPANVYVATFLGEPPMNILKGSFCEDNGAAYFYSEEANLQLPLPEEITAHLRRVEKAPPLLAGIRPQDLSTQACEFDSSARQIPVPGEIKVWEFLGEKNLLVARRHNCDLVTTHAEDCIFQEGKNITLYLNPQKLHYFEEDTGISLREVL